MQEPINSNPEDVVAALERVLHSRIFAQSPRMCRFLRYIVEAVLAGEEESLKETTLAVAVFDRRPDYDPKLDSIVRVEARRLRGKLLEYYSGEGADDPLRIVLEKGTYRPEFTVAAAVGPAASKEPPPPAATPPRSSNYRLPAVLPLAALILIAAALWWVYRPRSAGPVVSRFFTTAQGSETRPAFSPDGESLAYAWTGGPGPGGIYVQKIGSDTPILVSSGKAVETLPAWSPDGSRIAFYRASPTGRFDLVTVASMGGGEKRITDVAGEPYSFLCLDWAPDAKSMLIMDRPDRTSARRLYLLDLQTGQRSPLTNPPAGPFGDGQASFSPDGRRVLFTRTGTESVEDLFVVDLAQREAEPKQVTHIKRGIVGSAWAADGRSILFVAKLIGSRANLWRIRSDGRGDPVLIPEAGDNPQWPAVARRGGRAVVSRVVNDVNVLSFRPGRSEPPSPVLTSTLVDTSPQVSPDGQRLAFRSTRNGSHEIWISRVDGIEAVRLTNIGGPLAGSPRWSPDGKFLAYDSREPGNSDIYIIPSRGGSARRLTDSPTNEAVPSWSVDGRFVYFASDRTKRWEVWKRAVAGGPAVQVTSTGGFVAFESPDGDRVYYSGGPDRGGLWRLPVARSDAGNAEQPVLPGMTKRLWGNWAIGRDAVYYIDYDDPDDVRSAWIHSLDLRTRADAKIWKLANPPAAYDNGLGLAPDGKTLFFSQVDRYGTDLILLENFR